MPYVVSNEQQCIFELRPQDDGVTEQALFDEGLVKAAVVLLLAEDSVEQVSIEGNAANEDVKAFSYDRLFCVVS